MKEMMKDAQAKKAVEALVKKLLGGENIRKIIVKPVDDYAGEPALYVNIHWKRADNLPSIERRSELRDAVRQELANYEDGRFPYISIVSSHWEKEAENERNSA